MKNKIFGVLQRVGRSFMLPIAVLPVAGLLLGIGGSFTNKTMIEAYGLQSILGDGTLLHSLLMVLNGSGNIIFANLPIIFAVGVAIGMAKKEKEVAALASAIAFFVMHSAINVMLQLTNIASTLPAGSITSVVGIESLQMGVFGGIIVGLGVSSLHNKYYKIQLPQVLSFFGGSRFVPIVSTIVYVFVGILMFFIWPFVQQGIYAVGELVRNSGYGGTFLYGIMERALIPFGLHHVFYIPFWQTAVGGVATVCNTTVEGAQNIFFAQLACPETVVFNTEATRFMSGKFPLMIFGLPGAAYAMYKCSKVEKRELVGGLLLSAALTSMLTGITEPIEFTFLFVAPVLYGIHVIGAGLAYMFMHILKVGVGMTFSGGIIDLTLFGIMQGNAKTNWFMIVVAGILYFLFYYGIFSYIIKKYNFKTPGREDDDQEVKLYTRKDVEEKQVVSVKQEESLVSALITKGLGGKENISDVDCCATRLRCTVHNIEDVKDEFLTESGAKGIVKKGNGVQIIYGPHVSVIKSNLEEYLDYGIMEHPVKEVKEIIYSPCKGRVGVLSETPDDTFAKEMLGKGIVIFPTDTKFYAPFDGEVQFVFDTKHALGLTTSNQTEVLLHIGIDTVHLKGEGFNVYVEAGQKIKKGDLLVEIDLQYIKEHAKSEATPLVFTSLKQEETIVVKKMGEVNALEEILEIK
ncbi:PTS glucose transporter subunit IIA [Erysipelotrichaceae bacterium OH741_COT-311]|nr:PTS glucose transporter subunit IIA [Erysipelotrichaceae bacterium OH741_COT-311]